MNKVYVLIKADGHDVAVQVYKDKYNAAAYVMKQCFGEDWEIQMNDDEWEESSEIASDYEDLLQGYGFSDVEGVFWSIQETEISD